MLKVLSWTAFHVSEVAQEIIVQRHAVEGVITFFAFE